MGVMTRGCGLNKCLATLQSQHLVLKNTTSPSLHLGTELTAVLDIHPGGFLEYFGDELCTLGYHFHLPFLMLGITRREFSKAGCHKYH